MHQSKSNSAAKLKQEKTSKEDKTSNKKHTT
jgi:hypothetical protein